MEGGSFTQRILSEVAPHAPPLECCRASLVRGMRLGASGRVESTRMVSVRAGMQALHLLGIEAHLERVETPRQTRYLVDYDGELPAPSGRLCCARSMLRGAFLASGRVSRPGAPPHVEINVTDAAAAGVLRECARKLGFVMHITERRGRRLVTARSVDAVAAFLSSIGAQGGRLDYEEGRVIRDVRAEVNRRLNAETANLARTVSAGVRQVSAIRTLKSDAASWDRLPAALREAGELRLRWPREPLEHLAKEAGISRPAMSGRLQRLVARAEARAAV